VAGGTEFNEEKLRALSTYILTRRPDLDGAALASMVMLVDLQCYRELGVAATGSTYFRGASHPEIHEVGTGWFERFVCWAKSRAPLACRVVNASTGRLFYDWPAFSPSPGRPWDWGVDGV
jgi:hypothetical protein